MTSARIDCVHAQRCGGCALLGQSLGEQHAHKHALVTQALAAYPALAQLPVEVLRAADTVTEYRTRAKLVVSRNAEIGLYARGSHEVVDIPECRVLPHDVAQLVQRIRGLLAAQPVPVRGIDVRRVHSGQAKTGLLLTLLGQAQHGERVMAWARQSLSVDDEHGVLGIAWSAQAHESATLLGEVPVVFMGQDCVADRLSDAEPYYYATHGSFVQAHRGQALTVTQHVLEQLERALGGVRGKRVLELYAGSGALGLSLRKRGALPVLVERFEPALALVARAAEEQGLAGVATRPGDVETVMFDLVQAEQHFDAIVVDPPRRGLPASVRQALARLSPAVVVYVSCDPTTLARDLADLAYRGLAVAHVAPFDMMPLSGDVECVVTLRPAPASKLHVLYEDERFIAIDKPPHLTTTPQGEHDTSILDLLKAQLGRDALYAVHRLDIGTSGVCLFAKAPEHVALGSAALATGQKHYLALVRGVSHAKGTVKQALRDDGQTRDATTRYTRQRVLGGHSLLRVRPEQGRTHQVRKHLASIGHPVLGDVRYGAAPSNRHFEHKHGLDRSFLHLARIELVGLCDPQDPQPLRIESPLAPDLESVLKNLA